MSTSELTSSTEQSNAAQTSPAKDLLNMLRKNANAEDNETSTQTTTENTKPMDKLERKREIARRSYQKHKDELAKLPTKQVESICILLTQPDGKI